MWSSYLKVMSSRFVFRPLNLLGLKKLYLLLLQKEVLLAEFGAEVDPAWTGNARNDLQLK